MTAAAYPHTSKYKILWSESFCINDEEEENSDIEYESDSSIFWHWWRIIFHFSSKTQTTSKTFVSHNILYESYKASVAMCNIVYFYVLISTLRPNYLNFSKPCNFENRIATKSLTFTTAVLLEEHVLKVH